MILDIFFLIHQVFDTFLTKLGNSGHGRCEHFFVTIGIRNQF